MERHELLLAKDIVEPNAIYTREEAAQVLGVSLATLKRLIRAGHLVVSQPAGVRRIFIKGSSILQMLDETQRPAHGSTPVAEHSRLFTNGTSPRVSQFGSDESKNPSPRAGKLALGSKRALKHSPTFLRRASGKKVAREQGGSTG